MERQIVVTQRECPARLVPSGDKVTIPKDSFVTITQSLGGNYTVVLNGNMARVDGTDADALGLEGEPLVFEELEGDIVHESHVWYALKTIFDPEIPVNLVDLGLIYSVSINNDDSSNRQVTVIMTLTAPACGMGPVLVSDVKYRVAKVPNVDNVEVELVFDPPWNREMMSEEAQLETGVFF
ncbi:MAG: putative Fe-S cluster assembly protein SufT [Pseudomonadales bacterium]|nr:putative Fe-S cluster assembly protein SufT [Pseudomonadales bacterium]